MVTYTKQLLSGSVVSIPDEASIAQEMSDSIFAQTEFKMKVVYRKYINNIDNITGDIDRSSYTDYDIYAEIQIVDEHDNIANIGRLRAGDAIIFFPPYITVEYDGTIITPMFRPAIKDSVIWNKKTFRIDKLEVDRIGATEISINCEAKLVDKY